jgi:hypothetical protein
MSAAISIVDADAGSRARAHAARKARVDSIIESMAGGTWAGAGDIVVLARAWDLEVITVREYEVEAARVVNRLQESETLESARSLQLATAARLRIQMQRKVDLHDDPEIQIKAAKVALQATELQAKLLGTFAPVKVELVQSEAAFKALPIEERRERLRMARERLELAEAELAEEEARTR